MVEKIRQMLSKDEENGRIKRPGFKEKEIIVSDEEKPFQLNPEIHQIIKRFK